MSLSPKLELRQGQQLVMTPQLQQAIRLLQLSNMELTAYVEIELERNPLLEREDDSSSPSASIAAEEPAEPFVTELPAAESADSWLERNKSIGETTRELDTEPENVFPDAGGSDLTQASPGPSDLSNWSTVGQRGQVSEDDVNLEAYVSSETSLKDHLLAQVQLVFTDPAQRIIASYLVDHVDDAGYLAIVIDEIAERLGASKAQIESAICGLQTFDPPGVCARTLAECLAMQLKDRNRHDPQIARLLDNLDLLAAHNLTALKRAVGVDMDELSDMIAELKQLNPKPGLKFGSVQVQAVVPDVLVRTASDGNWIIELNSDTLPRVLVNRSYFTRVSKTTRTTRDKDYLIDCLQTANWLVKSLDQRARTILRVAEEIVRQQDGFFTYGVRHLRPLNLKTVADAIKMHESTVSRVTSNKYMATPRGIFELKFFFTSSIASSSDGEAHSSESVRHRIRQLIDSEPAATILSDDRIVELLKADGVDIARRTVAKYREAMRIPSSVQRRREKRMNEQTARATG